MKRILAGLVVAGCAGPAVRRPPPPPEPSPFTALHLDLVQPPKVSGVAPEPVLATMAAELTRSMTELGKQPEPPYFIAYELTAEQNAQVYAARGVIKNSSANQFRSVDVEVRVGDYALDNTRQISGRSERGRSRDSLRSASLSYEDDPFGVASNLWFTTDKAYKDATVALARVKVATKVKVAREDQSDDFSREPAADYYEPPARLAVDREAWERRLAPLSAAFARHPEILSSQVGMSAEAGTRYYVNTEGARLQLPESSARLSITASARADDGTDVRRAETFVASTADRLPADDVIAAKIEQVIADVLALRTAPVAEPYSGPVILEGRAAAVFAHEVFGHRIEGHRQKDETEGQTFSKKIAQPVTADWISIYDDPTIATLNGIELSGFYRFDNEGVPAQRASLIDNGVLKTFLLGRSPARGFTRSNGHGRRQQGRAPVARQANLVVAPSKVVDQKTLRTMLLAEVAKQSKPYGLVIREIDGGHTTTNRFSAQAFKLLPVMVYRLYPDGREELVRGADLEGTPITALGNIIAAGGEVEVFNGHCGAESGFIPVSGSSPSLLLSHLEVTKRMKGDRKPPILPPPPPQAERGATP